MSNVARTLSQIGEFGLLEEIKAVMPDLKNFPGIGIGDDCALIETRGPVLATTDTMVQGRHFRVESVLPRELGRKLVTVSLSDIAAMGGVPHSVLIGLQLPSSTAVDWVKELYVGISAECAEHGVTVVGGNITGASEISLTSTVLGARSEPARESVLLRSGARVGDDVWVTGVIGAAYLGLQLTEGKISGSFLEDSEQLCRSAYCTPTPQLRFGQTLAMKRLATSAIDVSDGLIQDAAHLAEASGVGLLLTLESIPMPRVPKMGLEEKLELLTGGEDYQLLFTATNSSRALIEELSSLVKPKDLSACISRIGIVVESGQGKPKVLLSKDAETPFDAIEWVKGRGKGAGFDHFRA